MGVFLADDDVFSSHKVRLITQEEDLQSAIQPRTMDEILYIASVVAQHQFPVDVVNNILEFAGVLLLFETETSEFCHGRSNMNEEYVQLQIPTAEQLHLPHGVGVGKCLLLVTDCVSKDQGWATDEREHNGTYRKSSSWCELSVSSTSKEEGETETARVPLWPNLRASRNFRHHRKQFDASTDLLEHVEIGSSVSIVLRSEYPGWTNSAKYGRVAACFAVELKDDFSFADVPFPSRSIGAKESERPSASIPDRSISTNEAEGPSDPCCLQ
uniref:Uncharacterized protein n=1 Tax=Hyaloperonospora arabidopsidis (strain Emoy2) TaxID=559515 RepID=M4BFN9_HYAAE